MADNMVNSEGPERERMQKTISMYLEEADTIKGLMKSDSQGVGAPVQESTAIPLPTEEIPGTHIPINQSQASDVLSDLGQMFIGIGREVRLLDEKYKVSETAINIAKDVTAKTAEVVSNPDVHVVNTLNPSWSEEPLQ